MSPSYKINIEFSATTDIGFMLSREKGETKGTSHVMPSIVTLFQLDSCLQFGDKHKAVCCVASFP
jgi:hypothetical protein